MTACPSSIVCDLDNDRQVNSLAAKWPEKIPNIYTKKVIDLNYKQNFMR